MKNLENFGVQELDAKEMEKVNGGGWFLVLAVFGILALLGYEVTVS